MTTARRQAEGTTADVALLLEGTYPFVRGGVSAWVDELLRGLPERTFSLVFLGGSRDSYGPPAYELPANVVHLECHYLATNVPRRPGAGGTVRHESAFAPLEALHEALRAGREPPREALVEIARTFGTPDGLTRDEFLRSDDSWHRLCEAYRERSLEPSFLDWFWTVRTMHLPLFLLASIARELPAARAYHAVSTGYAGYLGAQLALARSRPLVLTEHGIYTKERRIDLAGATWIETSETPFSCADDGGGYLRTLWTRFFEGLGRMAYAEARPIVSLYEGNRRRQVEDGADPARTRIVPNGIDVERFAPLRRRERARPIVGLLGRVVPIKDVRHFVRAMRSVCNRIPDAEGWIVGPTEEDEAYASECRALVASLGLEGRVRFLGFRRPEEVLAEVRVLALTSISEALPLVVLEAFASGVPVVATDVGSCRELVEGGDGADSALGAAGAVVPIARPEATADALLALLSDGERWTRASASGVARVERSYTRARMLESYRGIYDEACSWRA